MLATAMNSGLTDEEWQRLIVLANFGLSKLGKISFHTGELHYDENNFHDEDERR